MNILAIETSCDETSVAILRDGRHVLANIVASQIDLHKRYGGVVPELASRQHIVTLVPVLEEAFRVAEVDWDDIDAIAVTYGPGLAGALLVGLNAAKALAFARNKPLLAVNHIEAHVYSNWVNPESLASRSGKGPQAAPPPRPARGAEALRVAGYDPARKKAATKAAAPPRRTVPDLEASEPTDPQFPLLCLIVSGGHTELVHMTGHGQYTLLGKTQDDAAGEAFDKVARILGLPYPGGPAIERVAAHGNPEGIELPRRVMRGTLSFSFSGLKTALLHKVQEYGPPLAPLEAIELEEEAVAEQVTAEQPGALDRNRRARLETGELLPAARPPIQILGSEPPARGTEKPAEAARPAAPQTDAPVAPPKHEEPVVVVRPPTPIPAAAPETEDDLAEEDTDFDAPVVATPRDSVVITPAPVSAETAEAAAPAVDTPAEDEIKILRHGQAVAANPDADLPGLIRLSRLTAPEGDQGGLIIRRSFDIVRPPEPGPEDETPLEQRDEPTGPHVLGRDEPQEQIAPPPFLASRGGGTPPTAMPRRQPPQQADLPGFLRERQQGGETPADAPAAPEERPATPKQPPAPAASGPRILPVTPPEQRPAAQPPQARPQSTPERRQEPERERPRPAQVEPPAPPSDARRFATPPRNIQPSTPQPPAVSPRPPEREIRAIPKAVQAGREKQDDENPAEADLDRRIDKVPEDSGGADPGGPLWADDEGDDDPPPRRGGSVALEGPRGRAASARVPGSKGGGGAEKPPLPVADVAAAFQAAVVEVLVEKVAMAAATYEVHTVLVAGGVAANRLLREQLQQRMGADITVRYPPLALCTDNAAMVAAAAYFRYDDSLQSDWTLDIDPNARYIEE